ncbi:MAG: fibronectin type III domain-containing protein [Bacteroidales bacterium]|nr:fibronectin type III domain-containing protein [Bacteroidales bacterium]
MMKRYTALLNIILISVFIGSLNVHAQSFLTVADGIVTNENIPINGSFADMEQQQQVIYPENMLTDMVGGTITSMTFYLGELPDEEWGCAFSIRLGTIDLSAFANTTILPVDNTVEVYSGLLEVDATTGQVTIVFSTPYTYSGGNLLLDVQNGLGGQYTYSTFVGIGGGNASLYFFEYLSEPILQSFIPKTSFTYTGGSSCLTPTEFTLVDVDASSATVTWHPQFAGAQYQVLCNMDGETGNQAGWILTTDSFYQFNNLTSNSYYTAYVRRYCGSESEVSGSVSLSFYTACDDIIENFPWTEDFEDSWKPNFAFGQQNTAPQCWSIYNGGTTEHTYGTGAFYWKINQYPTQVHSGQHSAVCYTEYATARHNDWLVSPKLSLTGGQRVSFYVQNNVSNTTKIDEISVWISDENIELQAPADNTDSLPGFTQLFQTEVPVGEFHAYEVSLEGYSGNRYIAFVRRNSPDAGWYLCLDDVTVDDIPPCAIPVNLSATPSDYEVQLSWMAESESYNLFYKMEEDTAYRLMAGVRLNVDSVFILSGLEPASTYYWYVEAICDAEHVVRSAVSSFVTECAAIKTIPLSWDFENNNIGGTSTFPLPACWERKGSLNYPYVYSNQYYAHSGNACLFCNSNMANVLVVLPQIEVDTLPLNILQIRFFAKTMRNLDATIDVGVMTNPSDISTYTPVYTISSLTSNYTEYSTTFDHVSTTAQYIAIRLNSNNDNIYLDDLVLEERPSCERPSNIRFSNITSHSVEISWSSLENESKIYYQESGTGTYMETEDSPVTGTSYIMDNLTPNTLYNVYVASICYDGTEIPSSTFSFTTDCIAMDSIPYTWDFESNNVSGTPIYPLPACWSGLNVAAPYLYVSNVSTMSNSGSHCLYSIYPDSLVVVMPTIDVQTVPLNSLYLSFFAKTNYGRNATVEAGVILDPRDASTFVSLSTFYLTMNYQQYEVSFLHYEGAGANLAFRINADYDYVVIDDVELEAIPSCAKPVNLTIVNTTVSSVTLSWHPGNDENDWEVTYGMHGFNLDTATTFLQATSTQMVIGNLSNEFSYDFYVRSRCGEDGVSEWRGLYDIVPGCYLMNVTGTDTIYTCDITIYDDGGLRGDYSNNYHSYLVIYPENGQGFVKISGTLMAENSLWDYLVVYDGVGTGRELYRSNQENSSPLTIPSITSFTGPLTIHFHSDASVTDAGFVLNVSCESCVPPVLSLDAVGTDSIRLSWNRVVQPPAYYELVYGPVGFNPDSAQEIIQVHDSFYTISGLTTQTTCDVYVRTQCDETSYSDWSRITVSTIPYPPAVLPYGCNFENGAENALWTIENGSWTNKWYINAAVNNTVNGDSALYISKDNGLTNTYDNNGNVLSRVWAYRDFQFQDGENFVLSFDWRCYGEGYSTNLYDYLTVYIGTPLSVSAEDEEVPEDLVVLDRLFLKQSWTHAEYLLSGEYSNTIKRLYFFWKNDGNGGENPPAAIDNITLKAVNCARLLSMSVSGITSTSAVVSVISGDENMRAWQLKCGDRYVTITGRNSTTLTDLTPATEYELCARSICENGDTSVWSPVSLFVTGCFPMNASSLPYECGFENNLLGGTSDFPLPVCWNRTGTASNYPFVYDGSGYAYRGDYSLRSGDDPDNDIAILPGIDLNSLSVNELQLQFQARVDCYMDYTCTLEVGVMTNPDDAGSFVMVDTIQSLTNLYTEYTIPLEAYTGDGAYVAFRISATGTNNPYGYHISASVFIDDVVLDFIPSCKKPVNLVCQNATTSSISLGWTPMSEENQWEVAVGIRGFNPDEGEDIRQTDTNFIVVDGLSANQTYDFYVRAYCGEADGYSGWAGPYTGIPGTINMRTEGTDTIHTCDIVIYDDGGPVGDYSNNVDAYLVVYPEEEGMFVEISGTLMAEQSYYDRLVIYDGVGTDRELFASQQENYTQYSIPSVISSTGPLTVYFHSDVSNTSSGMELHVSCVSCVAPLVSLSDSYMNSAVVTWTSPVDSVYNFELVYGPQGFVPDAGSAVEVPNNVFSYTVTELEMNVSYDVYVRANCLDGNTSDWSRVCTFTTLPTQPATVPYSCDFESARERSSWIVLNEGQPNKWYLNPLEGQNHVLYISENEGQSNTYNILAASTVWAYRDIHFSTNDEFALSFDWRCLGEVMSGSTYDYLKVFIGDPVTVSAGYESISDDIVLLDVLSGQNTWTRAYYSLGSEYSGTTKRLYFLWHNDSSFGENPAAAIDNVTVKPIFCARAANITVSEVTAQSAQVSITPANENVVGWQLRYGNNEMVTVMEDTSTILTSLTAATLYEVSVRTICSNGDTSLWSSPVAFLTECEALKASLLPYICDFEQNNQGGTTEYPLPICWQRKGHPNFPYVYIYSYDTHSGNNCLFSGTDATDFFVILPEIDTNEMSISDLQVYFYAKISSFSGSIDVGVMTDPNDTRTYTPVSTINALANEYREFEVSMSHYSGTGAYIALRLNSQGGFNEYGYYTYSCLSIDDITLDYIPDCPQPASLSQGNITNQSVDLSWSDVAGSYIVYYRPEGTMAYDSVNNVTLTNGVYTLSGLAALTSYEWYVASVCDNGSVIPSHSTSSFTTMCDVVDEYPYQESFESSLGCWVSSVITGEDWWWQPDSAYGAYGQEIDPADGSYYALAYYPGGGHIYRLSSPVFDLSSIQEPYIKFYHIQLDWDNDQDYLKIYYKNSEEAEPVLLASYLQTIFPWQLDSLALPNPSEHYQLLFDAYLNYGHGVGVDKVVVYDNQVAPVEWPVVVTDTASDITENSATLNGTITDFGNQPITYRGFEWKKTNGGSYRPVWDTGTGSSLTYSLSGLSGNTSYTYRALVIAAGTAIRGEEVQFTTRGIVGPSCETPTNLQLTNVSATSVEVNWTAIGDEDTWVVEHKLQTEDEWQVQSVDTTHVTLTGLASGNAYQVRVKAVCDDLESDYIETTFTTSVGICQVAYNQYILLMPNPADHYIDLRVNSNMPVEEALLYNAFGQMVQTVALTDNHARIDLSGMASGMYFVRVRSEQGIITKKFIKR